MGGLAAVAGKPAATMGAYGESANVFGKTTNNSGYIEYEGPGYKLLLPSKWNPSKEKVFEGMDLRWEDNADAVTNVEVTITKSDIPPSRATGRRLRGGHVLHAG